METSDRESDQQSDRDEANRLVVCNCTSYCYFTLAIVLFSVGTVITILALDDSDNMFSSLGHMWLVGPIFISSGLMVAVKTIIYLRRETMITFLTRQRSLLRGLQYPSLEIGSFPRNTSNMTLPPSYDSVIGSNCVQQSTHLLIQEQHEQQQELSSAEDPPPSYEEAVLLNIPSEQNHTVTVLPQSRCLNIQDCLTSNSISHYDRNEHHMQNLMKDP